MRVPFASLTILGSLALLLIVQALPYVGAPFLLIGSPYICGLLLNLFLLCLAYEALIGQASRAFVVIPLVAYSAYYGVYIEQGRQIAEYEAGLKASNPHGVMTFDAATQDLIMSDAATFIDSHKVPVAYSEEKGEKTAGFTSFRLMTRAVCDTIVDDPGFRLNKMTIFYEGWDSSRPCRISFSERPTKERVIVVSEEPEIWKQKDLISEGSYRIKFRGKTIAEYRTATARRYASLPLPVFGCGYASFSSEPVCSAGFRTSFYHLDTKPDNLPADVSDNPVSILLSIPAYSLDEKAHFAGFAANARAENEARGIAGQVQENAYAALDRLASGAAGSLPQNFQYVVASDPDRLADNAEKIVSTIDDLLRRNDRNSTAVAMKLGSALTALSEDVFAPFAGRIFRMVRENDRWLEADPGLFIRAADAGLGTLPYYADMARAVKPDNFLKFAPVLAICRIGAADDTLRNVLKQNFAPKRPPLILEDYRQAVFLALLSIGEKDFVLYQLADFPSAEATWYKRVLEKQSDAIRPNNCMTRKWPAETFLGTAMKPIIP